VLARHGWQITQADVEQCIRQPSRLDTGYAGRLVAQRPFGPRHVLRVVYEELADALLVVTFYPGRRERYE